MKKKHGFVTQLIRHFIQFAGFLLFPGLFITVFSAVGEIWTAVIKGSFSPRVLFPQIILVFMVFLITALWGRFFCGFLCSFGMFQELIFFFFRPVIPKKMRIPERLDYGMKFLKYAILIFVIAGVWTLALSIDSSWNPWGVFGMLVSGNPSVISAAVPTVGFVLFLAICISSLFVERFFCRYLCPLGALFAVVSRKRLYKIKCQRVSCVNCGLCTKTCSMGIHIPEKDAAVSGDCIQCMKCIPVCPKESLSASPSGAIAGTAAAAAIGGTVIAGSLISFPVTDPVIETASDQQVIPKKEEGSYKDGVYTGVGKGFRGNTKVQVTVENGYISDITVLSFEDDNEFFHKAQSAVISEIIRTQILDVNPVSGATFSSNSIMDAVADAIEIISGTEQPADGEMDYDSEQSGADDETGYDSERPDENGGKKNGLDQPGEGRRGGRGTGGSDTGRHRRGWRGGSGKGRYRGR